MTDYKKYINALRKCAKEHDGDKTFTGQVIVSNLCRDTADLLEELSEQETVSKESYDHEYFLRKEFEIKIDELQRQLEEQSVTPQEPFINKPCVSAQVCEHDNNVALDKIRAKIESIERYGTDNGRDLWLRTKKH